MNAAMQKNKIKGKNRKTSSNGALGTVGGVLVVVCVFIQTGSTRTNSSGDKILSK